MINIEVGSVGRPSHGGDDYANEKAPEKTQITGDDIGAAALTGVVADFDPNGPEARRVLRKIDLHLLPLLSVTYLIQVRMPMPEIHHILTSPTNIESNL
jgi:hypothetical protein